MTLNYLLSLGLLKLTRSIPGKCLVKFSLPCISGTLVVSPGEFQVRHWRQVTANCEVRYYLHWVYQELLGVGLTVQQT